MLKSIIELLNNLFKSKKREVKANVDGSISVLTKEKGNKTHERRINIKFKDEKESKNTKSV